MLAPLHALLADSRFTVNRFGTPGTNPRDISANRLFPPCDPMTAEAGALTPCPRLISMFSTMLQST